jgi:hypothetical protein
VKQFGGESVEQVKARLERLTELEGKEEARRQQSLSELEREREARTTAEKERDTYKQQHETALAHGRLIEACAGAGVRNTSYAQFLVDSARRAGDTRPEAELITAYVAQDAHRAALGIPSTPASPNPLHTAPPPPNTPAPPNGQPGSIDANAMSKEQWAAYRASLG